MSLGEAEAGQRTREAIGPGVIGVCAYILCAGLAKLCSQLWLGGKSVDRLGERVALARWDDQAVVSVANQPARDGSYGVGSNHRQSLVHRLVDHETPRLTKRGCGD